MIGIDECATRYRFTIEQFMRMGELAIFDPADRVELVNGAIIELPPISSRHMAGVIRVHELFYGLTARTALISVQNPLQVADSQPQPDVVILRRRQHFYATALPTASDALLVVEVADETDSYDGGVKGPLYARGRVPEYWIVDVVRNMVTVYLAPAAKGYDNVNEYAAHGSWISPALRGREIQARDVLGPAAGVDER
jgi:Uma2 family endonuclease